MYLVLRRISRGNTAILSAYLASKADVNALHMSKTSEAILLPAIFVEPGKS